jgi:hypothetical protein
VRVISTGLLVLLAGGGAWVYNRLVTVLSTEEWSTALAAAMPLFLLVLLVFALAGLGNTLQRLYLASDLEMLMMAPVPHRAIFAAKLLECSGAVWLQGSLMGVLLVALGDARGLPAIYYLLAALLLLAAMVLATAAGMGLVILLARLIPPRLVRKWIPAAIPLVSLGFLLGQQVMMQWLSRQAGMTLLAEALLDPARLAPMAGGMGALAALSVVIVYRLFKSAFYRGWSGLQEVPILQPAAPPTTRRPGLLALAARLAPASLRFLVVKEWRTLSRDPRRLITPILLPLTTGVMLFPCIGASASLRPLFFWGMLIYMGWFATLASQESLMAAGREGRNIALLRGSPLPARVILPAKLLALYLVNVVPWGLLVLLLGGTGGLPLWQTALLLGLTFWGLAGACTSATAIGALGADFASEEPNRQVAGPARLAWMASNGLFSLLTIVSAAWFIIHLCPDSDAALAVRPLANWAAAGWLFANSVWPPAILAAGHVASWLLTQRLWAAAGRRLEGWQIG